MSKGQCITHVAEFMKAAKKVRIGTSTFQRFIPAIIKNVHIENLYQICRYVYSLNFLDFDLPIWENIEDVVLNASFFDEKYREIKYDYINLVFVRLPKFKKTLEECETLIDKLIFTFKHAAELNKKPKKLNGKFFEKLFGILQFYSLC